LIERGNKTMKRTFWSLLKEELFESKIPVREDELDFLYDSVRSLNCFINKLQNNEELTNEENRKVFEIRNNKFNIEI
jgi:hypothetical protein